MRQSRILAVTGASGYIGRHLVARARADGWHVITMGRGGTASVASPDIGFDLLAPEPPRFSAPPAAIIHLAANTGGGAETPDQEVAAARCLMSAIDPAVTRFIFISSQTAAADAPTQYGRTKAAIETVAGPLGAVLVRLGLVYGGEPAGLFGLLCRIVALLPVVPVLWPSPRVWPLHLDDLCTTLLVLAEGKGRPGAVYEIGATQPVTMRDFLKSLARYRLRRRRLWIPIPGRLAVGAALAAGRIITPLRDRAFQLLSLTRLPPLDSTASLLELGIGMRPIPEGLGRPGSARRALLEEASVMIRLVLGTSVSRWSLRRYVRACDQLALPAMAVPIPSWKLRLLVPTAPADVMHRLGLPRDMAMRLRIAMGVAEAMSLEQFHQMQREPWLLAGLAMCGAVLNEMRRVALRGVLLIAGGSRK